MARSSSCWVLKMIFILLISVAITLNVESAQRRRILKIKSVQDKFSAQLSIVKEENSGLEVLKNKLPGGPSPGTGNAFTNDGGVKSSWRAKSTLKNKLPGGPSPGTGNSYINNGGVKNSMLLKNKLPGGPSPGSGNSFIDDGGVKSGWRQENILKNKLPSGSSPGTGH